MQLGDYAIQFIYIKMCIGESRKEEREQMEKKNKLRELATLAFFFNAFKSFFCLCFAKILSLGVVQT